MEEFQEYHEKLRLVTDEDEKEPKLNETLIKQLVTVTKRWWHEGETTDVIYIRPTASCSPARRSNADGLHDLTGGFYRLRAGAI
jgi:hypothetical protein